MSAKDLASSASVRIGFSPATVGSGAAIAGPETDTLGYRWALVVLNLGVIGGGSSGGSLAVQGATVSGGTFANLAGAAFTILDADDNSVKVGILDLSQAPRFIKLTGTAATGGNNFVGASIILYGPEAAGLPALASGGSDELAFTALNPV